MATKTRTPITKKKMKTSTPLSPVTKFGAAAGKVAAAATAAGTAKTTSSKGSGMKVQRTSVNRATGKKTTTTKNLTPITGKEFKGSGMMKKTSTPIKKKTY